MSAFSFFVPLSSPLSFVLHIPVPPILIPAPRLIRPVAPARRQNHNIILLQVARHVKLVDRLHNHLLATGITVPPRHLEALAAAAGAHDRETVRQRVRDGRRHVRVAEVAGTGVAAGLRVEAVGEGVVVDVADLGGASGGVVSTSSWQEMKKRRGTNWTFLRLADQAQAGLQQSQPV